MSFDPNNERQLKQALEWFFLLQSENCTEQERQQFHRWLQKDQTNPAAYAHAQRLWSELNQLKEKPDSAELKALRRVHPRPKRNFARTLRMVALFFVSSALISIGWMEYHAETVSYITQKGEQRTVMLVDGSTIDLNTATHLHVKISLLQRKILLQSGEAMFDVHHELFRPFTVQTGTLTIRDIGTKFNVRVQDDAVSVAVLQGAVEMNGERVDAGYQRNYQPSTGLSAMHASDTEKVAAWQQGRLIFRQSALQQVTAELQRYHSVHFVFADPSLARETVSGTFDTNDLPLFLTSIQKILPIKVTHLPDEQAILLDWSSKK